MHRTCVCGKRIVGRNELCSECLSIYGDSRSEWPEWLKFSLNDSYRERYQEKRIDSHEITFTDLGVY